VGEKVATAAKSFPCDRVGRWSRATQLSGGIVPFHLDVMAVFEVGAPKRSASCTGLALALPKSLHLLPRQLQSTRRRPSPAPTSAIAPRNSPLSHQISHHAYQTDYRRTYRHWLLWTSAGRLLMSGLQMLKRQIVLDLSVATGMLLCSFEFAMLSEHFWKLVACMRTSDSYANYGVQVLVWLPATAGGTVRERYPSTKLAFSCILYSRTPTHKIKVTTSQPFVTVTLSTRSSRTTAPLRSARNKQSDPAKHDFLCLGSIEMGSN
jgi:hypothetical protein